MNTPTSADLQIARTIGDPVVDTIAASSGKSVIEFMQALESIGLAELSRPTRAGKDGAVWTKFLQENNYFAGAVAAVRVSAPSRTPAEYRAAYRAEALFARFGEEISCALLLAALPETYAAAEGSRVLTGAGRLLDVLPRRVRATAQYLMLAMVPLPERDCPRDANGVVTDEARWAWSTRASWVLRLQHGAIRHLAAKSQLPGVAVNQEDLLGTLLTFSVTVFEVLERLGVDWSDTQRDDYLEAWNGLGRLLGVGDAKGLPASVRRPDTVGEARATLAEIRTRQWPPIEPLSFTAAMSSTHDGRLLTQALLAELRDAMPRPFTSLPEHVMRQLVPSVVRERIGLRGGGLLESAADVSDAMWTVMGSMGPGGSGIGATSLDTDGKGLVGRFRKAQLHNAANFVTRNALVHFARSNDRPFVIPGLDDWVDALREP